MRSTRTIQSIQSAIGHIASQLYSAADRLHVPDVDDAEVWDIPTIEDLQQALEYATEAAATAGQMRDRIAIKIADRAGQLADDRKELWISAEEWVRRNG